MNNLKNLSIINDVLNNINHIIYISDFESDEIIYLNKKAQEVFGHVKDDGKRVKYYEYFQNGDNTNEFCRNEESLSLKNYTWFAKHPDCETHYMFHDSLIDIDGKKFRMGLGVDVSQLEQRASEITGALEIEKRLEECIKDLVSIGNFDGAINSVLDSILNYYNGDRVRIFDFDLENNACYLTFESCKKEIKSEIDKLKNDPIHILDKWITIFKDRSVVVLEDINKLDKDKKYKEEYDNLKKNNITNLIAAPIFYDGTIQGCLIINNPKINKNNTDFLEHLAFFISNEIKKNKLTKSLESLSYKDILTGLYNRNAYNKKLKEIDEISYKSKGILFVDMNGLKYLNDTFGHKYGDDTIKNLAQVLKRHFKDEQIFRISGDEFVILCLDIPYREFIDKSANLRDELIIEEKGLACVGYVWDENNADIEILEQQAEQLMYSHKQNYYMNNSNYSNIKKRPSYIDNIVEMLDKEEYLIYLQPTYSIDGNTICGAEALVRRKDKDGNIVTPFEFIHILERENLISHIDFFVFEEVCKTLVKWEKQGYEKYTVSSNFSRITVAENRFMDRVIEICDRTGVDCSQLVFEITESSNVINREKFSYIMSTLKERGIQFALDDMGTEYSTLEMLALEEIDIVKLDRSLIMRLTNGSRDQYIIENLISMCHKFNMSCTAEGIETKEQYELLANMKCDKIQGYLIGKPMAVEEFENKCLKKKNNNINCY